MAKPFQSHLVPFLIQPAEEVTLRTECEVERGGQREGGVFRYLVKEVGIREIRGRFEEFVSAVGLWF